MEVAHTIVQIQEPPKSKWENFASPKAIQKVAFLALGATCITFVYGIFQGDLPIKDYSTLPKPETGYLPPRCLPFQEKSGNFVFQNAPKMQSIQEILAFDRESIKVDWDFSFKNFFRNRAPSNQTKNSKHPAIRKLDSRRIAQILKTCLFSQVRSPDISEITDVAVDELEQRLLKKPQKKYIEDEIFWGENCDLWCICSPLTDESRSVSSWTLRAEIEKVLSMFKQQFRAF